MALLLGIDTGGTYTDAVLFDDQQSRVIAKAKSLTTRHDLAIGISGAVTRVVDAAQIDAKKIETGVTVNHTCHQRPGRGTATPHRARDDWVHGQ